MSASAQHVRLCSTCPLCADGIQNAADVTPNHFTGAESMFTVHENRSMWNKVKLMPRMLRDVSRIDMSCNVLGTRFWGLSDNGGQERMQMVVYVITAGTTALDTPSRLFCDLPSTQLLTHGGPNYASVCT